jgi:hypothetical protein
MYTLRLDGKPSASPDLSFGGGGEAGYGVVQSWEN